jgi:hypothetical protein
VIGDGGSLGDGRRQWQSWTRSTIPRSTLVAPWARCRSLQDGDSAPGRGGQPDFVLGCGKVVVCLDVQYDVEAKLAL